MKILDLNIKNIKIPVVFESQNSLPIVSLKLVFRASGVCSEQKSGVAKMTALMLNEGDKNLGWEGFAKELEKRAISLNVSAGFETFLIELNCLKEHFSFGVDMLTRVLKEPNFSDEILKKCQTITLGDIASNQNDNDYLAKCGLFEILYPKTNLSYPSIGTNESVKSINLDEIKTFFSKNLVLNNLFVVFGGDIKANELEILKKPLEILKEGVKNELTRLKTSQNEQLKEIVKSSEQAYIYFGSPYNVSDDERYKASVATFVLGESGFGSRLMEQIRVKRGLAYSAYAKNVLNLSHSQIFGYLQTKNESKDEAVGVVKDEFNKFIKSGISKNELEQAKKFLVGSLPLRLETLFRRLDIAYGEFYRGVKLGSFLDELEKIKGLKLNEINDFIASHDEISKLSFCILRDEI
ncbi:M16 family metallopeptidase [Campylobacter mucosalis]|uniref:M16 family metallopeptidase n=1 Tax=Campylobacter mucosalis TaxID=202 RepID=UPI0014706DC2|nr:pitrilysin family protein [Campylobacter mucosalis]